MKPSLLTTTCILILGMSATALADGAQGERFPRWYVGLGGGVSFLDDSDLTRGTATGDVEFDHGATAHVSLGYRPHFGSQLLDSLRFEIEGGYHYNSLDSARIGAAAVTVRDSMTAWTAMGNVLFDVRNSSQWTPYFGAGAGWASVELARDSGLGNINDHDNSWAYQFMAGLAYAPASIPLTEWSVSYRYLTIDEPEFTSATGRLTLDDLDSHNVEVGARFRF